MDALKEELGDDVNIEVQNASANPGAGQNDRLARTFKQQDDQFLATVIDARQTWINENPGEDGRDQVTPFDKFLYGTPQTAPLCEECGIELGERIGALVVKS